MHHIPTLLWLEMKRYRYTLSSFLMGISFYFLYLLLFQLGGLSSQPPLMLATILWIGFILVQLLYGPLWFKEDNHSDCLFDLYIAGVSPRSIIIVKFGFYCIVQWGTFSVCFLLAAMSLGLTKPFIKILEITLFIAIPIISSILMVLNLTLIKVQHSFSLLALLLFPLILPTSIVVLMAIKAFSQGWGEESFHYFIIAEIGLFLLTIPSCFLCATYLLRETLETI